MKRFWTDIFPDEPSKPVGFISMLGFFQFCFNYHVIVTVMYYRNYLFPNMKFDFGQNIWGSNDELS